MKEWSSYPQIELIGSLPEKKNFSVVPVDDQVRDALECLLILEGQLSQNSISSKQREGIVLAHTVIWTSLPEYYKSELADLTAMTK